MLRRALLVCRKPARDPLPPRGLHSLPGVFHSYSQQGLGLANALPCFLTHLPHARDPAVQNLERHISCYGNLDGIGSLGLAASDVRLFFLSCWATRTREVPVLTHPLHPLSFWLPCGMFWLVQGETGCSLNLWLGSEGCLHLLNVDLLHALYCAYHIWGEEGAPSTHVSHIIGFLALQHVA